MPLNYCQVGPLREPIRILLFMLDEFTKKEKLEINTKLVIPFGGAGLADEDILVGIFVEDRPEAK